jgi:hypothetical protein
MEESPGGRNLVVQPRDFGCLNGPGYSEVLYALKGKNYEYAETIPVATGKTDQSVFGEMSASFA